ncbi:hypothetical protein Pla52o_16600 [Novipirellula galeiformis]|uniref:Uncharacterized protein n=1 Tax=Novipirellula galeiformis TaxID=2528004 RepID=A0A5C6CR81_9BACT|nr:hypothetical protein [Novipirellula galeiformis]TWU25359.1 hypothetical protein Pla52o_16600 [Novipirellula galeiformis]
MPHFVAGDVLRSSRWWWVSPFTESYCKPGAHLTDHLDADAVATGMIGHRSLGFAGPVLPHGMESVRSGGLEGNEPLRNR